MPKINFYWQPKPQRKPRAPSQPLPAPPREFFRLVAALKPCGLWLRAARDERVLALHDGLRYRVTPADSQTTLLATNDLADVGDWIDKYARTAA